MDPFVIILGLMGIVVVVASLISGALERGAVPVVAVFLALGFLLGPSALGLVNIDFRSPELRVLATLALMLVLFSDGVTLNLKDLKPRRPLMLRILGPGTLVPAALIAIAAYFLLKLPAPAAIILGAALASTDPVLLRVIDEVTAGADVALLGLCTARPEFAASDHLRPREGRVEISLGPLVLRLLGGLPAPQPALLPRSAGVVGLAG